MESGGIKKLEPDTSQWCPVTGKELMGNQIDIQEISKKFFYCGVIKYWNRLLREVAEPPCVDILKT